MPKKAATTKPNPQQNPLDAELAAHLKKARTTANRAINALATICQELDTAATYLDTPQPTQPTTPNG